MPWTQRTAGPQPNRWSSLVSCLLGVLLLWSCQRIPSDSEHEEPSFVDSDTENYLSKSAHLGVVIEEVGKRSALEKAGLEPGDVVFSWKRLPNPPANPEAAQGELLSPFDWTQLVIEQAPRGPVELSGEKDGQQVVWTVETGVWEAEVRPRIPREILPVYLQAKVLIKVGRVQEGIQLLRLLAAELAGLENEGLLRCWLWLRIGETAAWAVVEVGPPWSWRKAHIAYQKALQEAKDPLSQGVVWDAIASAYQQANDFAPAREAFQMALASWKKIEPESLGVVASLNKLGHLVRVQGDLNEAEDILERALATGQKLAPDSLTVAHSLTKLGIISWYRGDLVSAESSWMLAWSIREQLAPKTLDAAGTLSNLGVIALERYEYDLAEIYIRRAQTIQNDIAPNSLLAATSLNRLGFLFYRKGDFETAEKQFKNSLSIKEKLAPGSVAIARELNNLGVLARYRGELDSAEDYLKRSLSILSEVVPKSLGPSMPLDELGSLAIEQADFNAAEGYFQLSMAIKRKLIPNSFQHALSIWNLSIVSRKTNNLPRAAELFESAIAMLESQAQNLGGSQDAKDKFRAHNRKIYQDAIELQLLLKNLDKAFLLLERTRAQSFLILVTDRDLVLTNSLTEELERDTRQIKVQHDRILKRMKHLDPEKDAEEINNLQEERTLLRARWAKLRVQARETSTGFATVKYPPPLDWEAVQKILDPGTVMLSFSVGKEETHLFIVQPERELRVQTLSLGEEELFGAVRYLRDTISNPTASPTLKRLYRLLIQPVEEELATAERILLVPDGPLHFLPFSALIRENGEYLVDWKPIHSVLSGTVYAELQKSRRPPGRRDEHPLQLAAFGDPAFPAPEELPQNERGEIREVRLRSALRRGYFDWAPLPSTRREVERVAELFPPNRVELFLDEAATEEAVKALEERNPSIVHFATHGHVDVRSPFDSALVLTIPKGLPEDRDNGLLQVWEILESVRFDADLVVLSACESGIGELRGGEGFIGLTRAFQIAGARSVLAALWNVADEATAELMIRFYRGLRSGLSKDEALRAAQLELIRGPVEVTTADGASVEKDFSSPYFWAGFQLVGDWQ